MIYLFEGALPLGTLSALKGNRAIAPAICLNRDVFMFVEYQNVARIASNTLTLPRTTVTTRHYMYFHQERQKAFSAINTTFVGTGYFRAAIYKTEVYIEIMYNVGYKITYKDKHRGYWWDENSRAWECMDVNKLTPAAIFAHYKKTQRYKRMRHV